MSLNSKLSKIKNVLTALTDNVYHYEKPLEKAYPYIVWAEDSAVNTFSHDNVRDEQVVHGTIDLFTKTEFDALVDSVNDLLLASVEFTGSLASVQYEDDTALIHYTWEFEVM